MSERKTAEPRDPLGAEPDDPELSRGGGFVPDIVRRAVLTGVGALFMTEEGIRRSVGDLKLPKDALSFLLSQADRTRAEVARVVTQEVRRFLESETLRREIRKLLTGVTLEVNATLQLKPGGESALKARVGRRRGAAPPGKGGEAGQPEHRRGRHGGGSAVRGEKAGAGDAGDDE